jgi:hypothetical protein
MKRRRKEPSMPNRMEFKLKANPQALELLKRMSEDREFRDRWRANPSEVLREYGIDVPESEIPDDVELPSEKELKELLKTAGEPDELGNVELDEPSWYFRPRIWLAMAFVPGEEDDNAD